MDLPVWQLVLIGMAGGLVGALLMGLIRKLLSR
jgi:hypothetical protein